jgi:hypothetical protein
MSPIYVLIVTFSLFGRQVVIVNTFYSERDCRMIAQQVDEFNGIGVEVPGSVCYKG